MGTPEYMAPEMLRGEGTGQTTDLYALGVVAYELLAGRLPFVGTNTPAIMYAQVHTPPPPLRTLQPELPQVLEDVVTRQLSKQPNERYSSAGSFVYALRAAAGAPRRSVVDQDAPVLDGIRATLASGDWRAALRDFDLLSQPSAPSALELRRQAEALRQREQPSTPLPVPPAPVPAPPSRQVRPTELVPPNELTVPAPGAAAPDPNRRLLLVAGGLGAGVLLLGGVAAGLLLRPDSGSGQASGQPTPPAGTPNPGATPNAEQTRIAAETRTAAVATVAVAATRAAATRGATPPPTSGAAGTAVPVPPKPGAAAPAATPGGGASGAQTRIGYIAAQSGGVPGRARPGDARTLQPGVAGPGDTRPARRRSTISTAPSATTWARRPARQPLPAS